MVSVTCRSLFTKKKTRISVDFLLLILIKTVKLRGLKLTWQLAEVHWGSTERNANSWAGPRRLPGSYLYTLAFPGSPYYPVYRI